MIWTKDALQRLYDVTQAVSYLPNVDRLGVQSLWTPNSYVNEITEEGFRSQPIIPGTLTADRLTPENVEDIRRRPPKAASSARWSPATRPAR